MTKQNSTMIAMILDRSGSMGSCRNGTIEGFNSFIESQRKSQLELNDDVKVTLVQFDDQYELNYNMLPLQNVPNLNTASYVPRGWTALHDAIGKTVQDVGKKLSEMPESERPSKVLVVIMTDGEENRSRNFSKEMISSMVKHQEAKYGWEFVYIGANQDSFEVGANLGVKFANTMNYTSSDVGSKAMYSSLDNMARGYRGTGKVGFDDPNT